MMTIIHFLPNKYSKVITVGVVFSMLIIIGCGSTSTSGTTSNDISKALPAECNSAILRFNESISRNVMEEIRVISRSGSIPGELKALYPKARDEWNNALGRISFSVEPKVNSLSELKVRSYSDWRSENLEDYQKFFLLLTEYRYGKYPSSSRDLFKQQAWIEKADCKKRIETIVKHGLVSNCRHSLGDIREHIKPVLLPENIEDCLKLN